MATWGELEKDTGLGLLGIKERYEALQAEHGLCGGQRRRDLARISELEQQAEEQGKELSQATEQVKDQAEQITELRAQLSEVKRTAAVVAVNSTPEESEVAELRTKLATAAADSAECASLKAELRSLRRELEAAHARLAKATEQLSAASAVSTHPSFPAAMALSRHPDGACVCAGPRPAGHVADGCDGGAAEEPGRDREGEGPRDCGAAEHGEGGVRGARAADGHAAQGRAAAAMTMAFLPGFAQFDKNRVLCCSITSAFQWW